MTRKINEKDISAILNEMVKNMPDNKLFIEVETSNGIAYNSSIIEDIILCNKEFKDEVLKGLSEYKLKE